MPASVSQLMPDDNTDLRVDVLCAYCGERLALGTHSLTECRVDAQAYRVLRWTDPRDPAVESYRESRVRQETERESERLMARHFGERSVKIARLVALTADPVLQEEHTERAVCLAKLAAGHAHRYLGVQ